MIFYKINKKGRKLDDAYWVTESSNKYGEIWVNLRGGWCMKSADDEIVAVAEYHDEEHKRYELGRYNFSANVFSYTHLKSVEDVVAWCEIPRFEEE